MAETFNKISRGHIKQNKDQLKTISKGSSSITEYMHSIKALADELASMVKPLDHEDHIDCVLEGSNSLYDMFIEKINSRDSSISFEELHEKLINKELALQKQESQSPTSVPITAFTVSSIFSSKPSQHRSHSFQSCHSHQSTTSSTRQPKPFLGKCQWCGERGHVLSQCVHFTQKISSAHPPSPPLSNQMLGVFLPNLKHMIQRWLPLHLFKILIHGY